VALKHVFDKLREARHEHEWLNQVIEEGLRTERKVKPLEHHSWLAVSRVGTMCTRAEVMASVMDIPLIDERDAQDRWRADRGTALHKMFQEQWLAPMGYILGGWRCPYCAHIHGAVEDPDDPKVPYKVWMETAIACPKRCAKCGKEWRRMEPFQYVEPWSIDKLLRVRGRIDAILRLPGYYPEVADLKSTHFIGTGGRPWSVIRRPRMNDVKQLHWYMDSTKCRRGRIIYMDPSAEDVRDALVEHKVSFNPSLMHKEKEKVRGLRKALQASKEKAVTSGSLPDCPNDRKLYGRECACVEMEGLWSGTGD